MMIRVGMVLTLLASLLGFVTVYAVGETWSPLGSGMNNIVYALAFDSSGNLYAGGSFTSAGGTPANHIAKWNGESWSPLGSGVNGEDVVVYALAIDSSRNLYAGGSFASAGGVDGTSHIAKWDGTAWSALGSGMNGGDVYALAVDDSGNLYAGGSFNSAGGVTAKHVAKWDGTSWSALDSGVSGGDVYALAVDDSGNLYVGGSFTSAGGDSVNHNIAKWDGMSWSALGDETRGRVNALKFDPSGNLYAGGSFTTAGGVDAAKRVAKWNGAAWSALGSGVSSTVRALAVDGSGYLYAGGDFAKADGDVDGDVTVNHVAKWDGTSWSALGSGMDKDVHALAIGSSGNLYAGGEFTTAGGAPADHIARWALPGIAPTTGSSLFCTGENTTVSISLMDVVDLFGYQFIVHYDPSLVNASGAFVNTTFFDTTIDTTSPHASIPPDWNASCSGDECKFAVSKVKPGEAVTGSGAVAQITLTGVSAGTFDLTISDDILSDREEAQAMQHTAGSLPLTVCGYANVSGTVSLQGHTSPVNAGQVTLTDLGGIFGSYTTSFNPDTGGAFTKDVKVMPGGSNYQFDTAHGLYLGNRMTHMLNPLDSYTASATRLLGGDANNDRLIDLSDLTCIGGSFGGAPDTCGATGSSDINADGAVNILDLVLPGSNYGLTTPRSW
ncbi:MAG: hypothetical protein KKC71_01120 [Chloroflexi bacterium]|nr:hypothetical protein [Chloroflexota bacterium]